MKDASKKKGCMLDRFLTSIQHLAFSPLSSILFSCEGNWESGRASSVDAGPRGDTLSPYSSHRQAKSPAYIAHPALPFPLTREQNAKTLSAYWCHYRN